MPMSTKLQSLACEVACEALGVECPSHGEADADFESGMATIAQDSGIPLDEILALVELVAKIIYSVIEDCNAPESKLIEIFRKPQFMQRIGFRNRVFRACESCHLRRWQQKSGDIAEAALNLAKSAPKEQLIGAIFETRNEDWLAI